MLTLFRRIALVEGLTTLFLFLVAMPLKYFADLPGLVPPAGWVHGVAFLAYLLALAPGLAGRGASAWLWLRTLLASLIPFGTFLNEPALRRLDQITSR